MTPDDELGDDVDGTDARRAPNERESLDGTEAVQPQELDVDPDAALTKPAEQLVRGVLRTLGVQHEELDEAAAEGRLLLLAIEELAFVDDSAADVETAAERSGLGVERLRKVWRSLGFTDPPPGEPAFSEVEIANLAALAELIDSGALPFDVALQVTRVLGSSTARIAESLIDAVVAPNLARSESGEPIDEAVVAQAAGFLPTFPNVLEQVWRRHVQVAARRRLMRVADADESHASVVGFADLVRFTALAQELEESELAHVVSLFEELAYDVVLAGGGRVVKMIGDEVMFLVDDPAAGAEIALGLADASRDTERLPDVRVGLALGPVLERDGDAYGPTVNLASRLTSIAHPSSVVVERALRNALADNPMFSFRPIRPRSLKDIGRVSLAVLRWAEEAPSTLRDVIDERRRQMAGALRERFTSDDSEADDQDEADRDR